MYINESSILPSYAIPFTVTATSPVSSTTTQTQTETTITSTTSSYPSVSDFRLEIGVLGFTTGIVFISIITVILYRKRESS